jgi:imidazolonepropionase
METLLVTHARLATMRDGRFGEIAEGALHAKDGAIAWVGPMADLPRAARAASTVIDAKGALMTPGLVDCHTHLVYGGNRAREMEMRLAGKSYAEIARAGGGIVSTVAATRARRAASRRQRAGCRR